MGQFRKMQRKIEKEKQNLGTDNLYEDGVPLTDKGWIICQFNSISEDGEKDYLWLAFFWSNPAPGDSFVMKLPLDYLNELDFLEACRRILKNYFLLESVSEGGKSKNDSLSNERFEESFKLVKNIFEKKVPLPTSYEEVKEFVYNFPHAIICNKNKKDFWKFNRLLWSSLDKKFISLSEEECDKYIEARDREGAVFFHF